MAQRLRIAAMFGGPVQRVKASTATEPEHAKAREAHLADRVALKSEVSKMEKSGNVRERNTARWFATGLSKLYALTPTGDAKDRAQALGKDGELAMFGGGASVVPDAGVAAYNSADMEDATGVMGVPANSGGFRLPNGGAVYITQPSRRDELNKLMKEKDEGQFDPVSEALKHETQHETDYDFNAEVRGAHRKADLAWAEYRTEFRAYTAQEPSWLAGPLTEKETGELKKLGLAEKDWADKTVQFKILSQIVPQYPRVLQAWKENEDLRDGRSFKAAVLAMAGSIEQISVNPQNSPEVAKLWVLLNRENVENEKMTGTLIEAALAVDAPSRSLMLKADHLWKPWISGLDWAVKDVRALLSDDPTAFGKARSEHQLQESLERRQVEREKPPVDQVLERFKSWDAFQKWLGEKGLDKNPVVIEELGDWSKWDFASDGVGAFLGNTTGGTNGVDWWGALEL